MALGAGAPLTGSSAAPLSAVDVRVVLFAIQQGELRVAIARDGTSWQLPGVSLQPGEALDVAASRALQERLNTSCRYLEQLYTLTDQDADTPAVTVAYLGIADPDVTDLPDSHVIWRETADTAELAPVDSRIVDYAVVRLRAKLGYTTIAFHLLPPAFTLSDLQQVYEIVLDRSLDKRNFRRRIQSAEILAATEETRREGSHRPARLYRFRAVHDADTYLTPVWAGAPDGESGTT